MNLMFKAAACVLIAVILSNAIPKERKDLSILLCICVCTLVCTSALSNLRPVLAFIDRVHTVGNLNSDLLKRLIQVLGVSVVSEIIILICQDSGNGALGKSLQIMATTTILYMAIPIFEELIILIEEVLGAI